MDIKIPPTPINRLREKLEAAATGESAPEVHYRTVDTPIGRLLLAGTEVGVVRLAFENENEEAVLQELADKISPRILHMPKRLDAPATWLDKYFGGSHATPATLRLDERLIRGYRKEVLRSLRGINYGERVTYQHLAAATSSPNAVRAVGSACATNPLPLLIPCHRVVRSDGSLGNYRGGSAAKEWLLNLEAAAGR